MPRDVVKVPSDEGAAPIEPCLRQKLAGLLDRCGTFGRLAERTRVSVYLLTRAIRGDRLRQDSRERLRKGVAKAAVD